LADFDWSDVVSDPIEILKNSMGGEVQGESRVPRSIKRWH